MEERKDTLAIIVTGGNASGINIAIAALFFAAKAYRWKNVVGYHQGFELLSQGECEAPVLFDRSRIERIKGENTSFLRLSRRGAETEVQRQAILANLQRHYRVTHLVIIGGDGSAGSAARVLRENGCNINIAVLLKSIDGFGSAHVLGHNTAASAATNHLMRCLSDTQSYTRRAFALQTMGREVGLLAHAAAVSAGTMAFVPEMFEDAQVSMNLLVDLFIARAVKRIAQGAWPGAVVLAEGMLDAIEPEGIKELEDPPLDHRGRKDYSRMDLGQMFRNALLRRAKEVHGLTLECGNDRVGYTLRGEDPNGFDMRLAQFLSVEIIRAFDGGMDGFMASQGLDRNILLEPLVIQQGEANIRPRGLDRSTAQYRDWVFFMDPLAPRDLEDRGLLDGMAALTKYSPEEFAEVFRAAAEFKWIGR